MPTLHKPSIFLPDNIITTEETLTFAKEYFKDSENLEKAMQLIKNLGIVKRHLIQPVEVALQHPGFGHRIKIFEDLSKRHLPPVINEALFNANMTTRDISAIIFVSCSVFMMPSLTAWLINSMGFSHDTVQIPIAQLGCAAGVAAINRAQDFILAHPGSNVLIVSCEFCSLSYQPADSDVGSLLSDGLFGDAITSAVVTDHSNNTRLELKLNSSYLIPDTEDWIRYEVKDTGFHFRLDSRVPGTMKPLAPVMRQLSENYGWDIESLDYYIVHAGGPRIIDDLCKYLNVAREKFQYSRNTLANCGNIASSVVFEVYRRMCEDNCFNFLDKGIIAGFGPGITAEMNLSMVGSNDA